jgi:hypothetical protein
MVLPNSKRWVRLIQVITRVMEFFLIRESPLFRLEAKVSVRIGSAPKTYVPPCTLMCISPAGDCHRIGSNQRLPA